MRYFVLKLARVVKIRFKLARASIGRQDRVICPRVIKLNITYSE